MPNRKRIHGPRIMELYRILTELAAIKQPEHEHLLQVEFRQCPRGRAPFYVLFEKVPRKNFFSQAKEIPLAKIDAAYYLTEDGIQICLRTFEHVGKPLAKTIRAAIKSSCELQEVNSIRFY